MSRGLSWRFGPAQAAERLRAVSDELDAAIAASGAPEQTRFAARLVVEEIVLNALEHGGAREVTLEVDPDGDPLRLVIEDDGAPFDLTARRDGPSAEATDGVSVRGRGIALVHLLARHVEHASVGGRNRATVSLAR